MSELSHLGKLFKALDIAKSARVGMELTYFDVLELSGELDALKGYIAELEAALKSKVIIINNQEKRINELAERILKNV